MQIKLVSKTEPITGNIIPEFDSGKISPMSTSDYISYVAKISNPDNQLNFDTAEGLIRYLIRKSHWSPFQMVDLTYQIKTTRDIGRQILRHRSFEFQEFSQRYAEVDISMFEDRECRLQDTKNRQSSIVTEEKGKIFLWESGLAAVKKVCGEWYKTLIKDGIAKEQARTILPEGLTPSTMYMKGSVRSWFHFCLVRCHPGTQKEHREIANAIWVDLQNRFDFFKNLDMQKLSIVYQEMFEKALKDCTDAI
jgi:thymidylate synthase (FAD)